MNYTAVFKNSASLIWRHKILVALGLLLVSNSIPGIVGSHLYSRFWLSSVTVISTASDPMAVLEPIADFFINPNLALIIGSTLGIFLGTMVIWLLTTIGEVALIRGVADFDEGHPRSVTGLLSVAVKMMARIIAIDTLIFLPLFLILLVQLLTVGAGMIAAVQLLVKPGNTPADVLPVAVIVGLILLILTLLFIPVTVLTLMLRLVAFRSAVLENMATRPSIHRAWSLIREKLGEFIIVALLLYAVSYAVGMITSILVIPLSFGGMFILFQSVTPGQPLQFAEMDGFLTLITLTSVVGILPNIVYRVYSSAVWTLAYREWQRES